MHLVTFIHELPVWPFVLFYSCNSGCLLHSKETGKESTGRYDTLPPCLWSNLTILPNSERTSKMWFDSANSFTCSLQDGAGLGFLMLLNNPAAADLGFRWYRPIDSLSSCPQGFTSNHINFERGRDSSLLTVVKSA